MAREEHVFSIDVKIVATAYVRATSKADAIRKARRKLRLASLELPARLEDLEVPISGRMLADPELPEVSLSPAMTCYGPTNTMVVEDHGPAGRPFNP